MNQFHSQSIINLINNTMKTLYTLSVFCFFFSSNLFAQCALFQGPNSANVFVNDASIGTIPWNNPGFAKSSDDARADAALDCVTLEVSQYLKITDFGFSIPSTATICGIELFMERQFAVGSEPAKDNVASLVKNNVIGGTNNAINFTWSYNFDINVAYGSNTDLWGTTWTPADINSSGFGAAISAQVGGGSAISNPKIDQVTLKVYYSTATSIESYDSANDNISIYPNPSNGYFKIKNSSEAQCVEIYNTLGECIYKAINAPDSAVDISFQPNGIYFVRFTSEKEIITKKLIIQ